MDQDVVVERVVVERAGEEAVKVAWEVVLGVDVDGEVVEGCSVGFEKVGCSVEVDWGGCSGLVVGVLSSFSSSTLSEAPAIACS